MYENLVHILAKKSIRKTAWALSSLDNYTDLILEANTRFRNNKERICGFKEEVKKLLRLTRDTLASLADAKDVLKANKQRIAELKEEKAAIAALQVIRDVEASQCVTEFKLSKKQVREQSMDRGVKLRSW
ncbi:hypothetical protein R1flu_010570 [Riccia fluitans]|uniref:Uncharacterized protein n=1 Tax=Riccia fluitans TaxID=41844 RepID=A0ABD1Z5H3_9MARC